MTAPQPPRVTLAASVAAVAVLGVLVFDAVVLREDDAALTGAIEDALELLRASGPPEAAFEATRAMYRRFGIDPTRRRPSSEALLRRIRKGDRLPRINRLGAHHGHACHDARAGRRLRPPRRAMADASGARPDRGARHRFHRGRGTAQGRAAGARGGIMERFLAR